VIHSAANVHDSKALEETVDAIEPVRRISGQHHMVLISAIGGTPPFAEKIEARSAGLEPATF
jgi:hypothetical protein